MAMDRVNQLKEQLSVFADSEEIIEMLLHEDKYATQEAAVHIEGLWNMAQQLMAYIEETNQ